MQPYRFIVITICMLFLVSISIADQNDPDKPTRLGAITFGHADELNIFPYVFGYKGKSHHFHNIIIAKEGILTGSPMMISTENHPYTKAYFENPDLYEDSVSCPYAKYIRVYSVNHGDSRPPCNLAISPQFHGLSVLIKGKKIYLASAKEHRLEPVNENVLGFTFLTSLDLAEAKWTKHPYLIVRNKGAIELMKIDQHSFSYPQYNCQEIKPQSLPYRLSFVFSENIEVAGIKSTSKGIEYSGAFFMTAAFSEKAKDEIWSIYSKSIDKLKEKITKQEQEEKIAIAAAEKKKKLSKLFNISVPSMKNIYENNGFTRAITLPLESVEYFNIPFSEITISSAMRKTFWPSGYEGDMTITAGSFHKIRTIYQSTRYYHFYIPISDKNRIVLQYTLSTASSMIHGLGKLSAKIEKN